jgi:hypothetical protein
VEYVGRIRLGGIIANGIGTLRTFDSDAKRAQEIAQENGREDLAKALVPRYYHYLEEKALASLEMQLHQLMREYAGRYVRM